MRIALLILLFAASVNSATYYVRTDGNNANAGTTDSSGGAWRNPSYAATNATSGDLVIIKAGTYSEYIPAVSSGITLAGTRSGGSWTTIINPSTSLDSGWVSVGSGVWSNQAPFYVAELTITNARVGFISDVGTQSYIGNAWTGLGATTGMGVLQTDTALAPYNNLGGIYCYFWKGVDALYVAKTNSVWLRLRDGSDPNGIGIRVAANATGSYTQNRNKPAIDLSGKSNVAISNLMVLGAYNQICASSSTNCVIVSNALYNGQSRIYCDNSAFLTVRGNVLNTAWIGGEAGAWGGCSGTNTDCAAHVQQYCVSKFLMGETSQFDYGIYGAGTTSNRYELNTISGISDGIVMGTPTRWGTICSNTIANNSAHGVYVYYSNTNIIFDNQFSDNLAHMRFEDWQLSDPRLFYIFRNTFYNPTGTGTRAGDVFFWAGNSTGTSTNKIVWLYQNSFSGGRSTMHISYPFVPTGGLLDVHMLNNIFNDQPLVYMGYNTAETWSFLTNAWMLDFRTNLWTTFDTSVTSPAIPGNTPAWIVAGNTKLTTNQWSNAEGMSFALPASSQAVETGMDIPSLYSTLPQNSAVKVGSSWDIGALEFGSSVGGWTVTGNATVNGVSTFTP